MTPSGHTSRVLVVPAFGDSKVYSCLESFVECHYSMALPLYTMYSVFGVIGRVKRILKLKGCVRGYYILSAGRLIRIIIAKTSS